MTSICLNPAADAGGGEVCGGAGQESGGGVLGAIASAVGKLVGGGGAAALLANFTKLGFSADQVQKFLPAVLDFLKSKLPANVMNQVSALIPAGEAPNT